MTQYRVRLSEQFLTVLSNLSHYEQRRIRQALALVAADPEPDGIGKVRVVFAPFVYIVREIDGLWLIYRVEQDEIRVVNVGRLKNSPPHP